MHRYKIIPTNEVVIIEKWNGATRILFEPFLKGELKPRVGANSVRISHVEGYKVLGVDFLQVALADLDIDGATTDAEKQAMFADPSFLMTSGGGSSGGGGVVEDWTGNEYVAGTITDEDGVSQTLYGRSWVLPGNGTALVTAVSPFPTDIKKVYHSRIADIQGSPYAYNYIQPTIATPIVSSEDNMIGIIFQGGNLSSDSSDTRYHLSIRYTKN